MKYDYFVAGRTRNSDKIDLDAGGDKAIEQFEKMDLRDDLVRQFADLDEFESFLKKGTLV